MTHTRIEVLRGLTVLGLFAAVLAALVAGSGTASAATSAPASVTNCGTVTCSDYASREETRQMLALINSPDGPQKLLSSTACLLAGGSKSSVCKVAKAAIKFGVFMTKRILNDAVSRNACYKTTYEKHTGAQVNMS